MASAPRTLRSADSCTRSAVSSTTTFAHTRSSNSSLVTRCPARSTSVANKSNARGRSEIASPPLSSRRSSSSRSIDPKRYRSGGAGEAIAGNRPSAIEKVYAATAPTLPFLRCRRGRAMSLVISRRNDRNTARCAKAAPGLWPSTLDGCYRRRQRVESNTPSRHCTASLADVRPLSKRTSDDPSNRRAQVEARLLHYSQTTLPKKTRTISAGPQSPVVTFTNVPTTSAQPTICPARGMPAWNPHAAMTIRVVAKAQASRRRAP